MTGFSSASEYPCYPVAIPLYEKRSCLRVAALSAFRHTDGYIILQNANFQFQSHAGRIAQRGQPLCDFTRQPLLLAPESFSMNTINYNAHAALYLGSDCHTAFAQGARRFSSAAKAIRFALEEVAPVSLRGARMIVDGRVYDAADLQRLYVKNSYPLLRKPDRQAISLEDGLSYID